MGKDTVMGGLVLKGLGFGLAKRFRWFGGICAPRDCSLWWVVVTLPLGTAQPPCTYRKRNSTVRSPSRCTSVARLVGGLPNPHPRWVGRNHSLDHPRAPTPALPRWFARGLITFHFILPNSLNKPPTRLHRSLSL
jgi:hypothetical protein